MLDEDFSAKPPRAQKRRHRLGIEGQRERILEAGLKILDQQPYDQVTVQGILETAQVSRQTFYRCFDGKSDLYHRIFERGNKMFLDGIHSLDKSGSDPEQVADRALTGALLFVVFGGRVLRALYRETIRAGSEFAGYRSEVLEALIRDVSDWTRQRLAVPVEPTLIRALVLTIEQLLFALAGDQAPSQEEVEKNRQAILLIVRGVYAEMLRTAGHVASKP